MPDTVFAFWREPGNEHFFEVREPVIQYVNQPDLASEGFYVSPFNSNTSACFIKGKIEVNTKLNEIIIDTYNEDFSPDTGTYNYTELVKTAIDKMKNGDFDKVVLARTDDERLPYDFSVSNLLINLSRQFPKALVYCFAINSEVWIGASPEILLQKETAGYKTFALAGTRIPELKGSFGNKEILEQAVVKDYILECLAKNQTTDINISPLIEFNTGNLLHLLNEITFNTNNVLPIIKSIHPTPAVCGFPLQAAKSFIANNEGMDRGFYAGFLGPIYPNGKFSFWVNLRCAKLLNRRITFYAGAGILVDSDPESEFLETERKMDTLRTLVFKNL